MTDRNRLAGFAITGDATGVVEVTFVRLGVQRAR
jgi:hypothetical protein